MIKYRWFPAGTRATEVVPQPAPAYFETEAGTIVITESGEVELPFEAQCQVHVAIGHDLRKAAIFRGRLFQVWLQGTTVVVNLSPHGKLAVTFE